MIKDIWHCFFICSCCFLSMLSMDYISYQTFFSTSTYMKLWFKYINKVLKWLKRKSILLIILYQIINTCLSSLFLFSFHFYSNSTYKLVACRLILLKSFACFYKHFLHRWYLTGKNGNSILFMSFCTPLLF